MFNSSNTISRAISFYIPKENRRKRKKIFVGNKKTRYFYGDREFYRNEYLKSEHWKELRLKKLSLNPICETCGNTKRIEPHHLQYKNLYDVDVSDLKSLCRKCHVNVHNTDKKPKKYKSKNVFRHRNKLILKVSRMLDMDKNIVKQHLEKLILDKSIMS